jgi:hypothetical protein
VRIHHPCLQHQHVRMLVAEIARHAQGSA